MKERLLVNKPPELTLRENERHVNKRFGEWKNLSGGAIKRGSFKIPPPPTRSWDTRLSVNYSTNKPREWRLTLCASQRQGSFFFLELYFSFPDSDVADGTQTQTGDGAQNKSGRVRRDLTRHFWDRKWDSDWRSGKVCCDTQLFLSFFPKE